MTDKRPGDPQCVFGDVVCFNCEYWDRTEPENEDEKENACRRRAPTHVDAQGRAVWPITRFDDWCGDFVGAWAMTDEALDLAKHS